MNYRVILSPLAKRDLINIELYISKDSPEAAKKFCDQLLTAAESLNSFPLRGNRANFKQVHTLVYKSYLIFYDFDAKAGQIEILRFWHAARSQNRLRLKEESPDYNASPSEMELRRHQLASGEGAVIPGDEVLFQQAQSQQ